MGCFKLHIENEPTLSLAYSKKGQKPLKNSLSYYSFGLQHSGYNDGVSGNANSKRNLYINSYMLKRYWFTFSNKHILPPGLNLGCGITAYTKEDALFIMKENVFTSYEFVQPVEVVENIHVSTLDENHIIPNMLPPNNRGIWFPIGYR